MVILNVVCILDEENKFLNGNFVDIEGEEELEIGEKLFDKNIVVVIKFYY